jgi:diguanylate cyclase
MTATSGQGEQHWKTKYYNQLDQLEKKEKEWSGLESVLKRAIGRLTLAAEGQNDGIDRYIREIRLVIKNDIDRFRLESILDDLSKLLVKAEQSQEAPSSQKTIDVLHALVEALKLPQSCDKDRQKCLKLLAGSTDKNQEECMQNVLELLTKALKLKPEAETKKTGFLDRIMGATEETAKTVDISATASIIAHVMQLIPWPEKHKSNVRSLLESATEIKTDKALSTRINQFEKIINEWKNDNQTTDNYKVEKTTEEKVVTGEHDGDLEAYRSCVLSFLEKFDNELSPDGKISALRVVARDAVEKTELDKLASSLADMLLSENNERSRDSTDIKASDLETQPNIQELLIRLLEQLVVPIDLHKSVEEMKVRLEQQTHLSDWKQLLKDVAALINSIRIRMQQEKHEFENFLQQVTSRLKEMDSFLQNENLSIDEADQKGKAFDVKVDGHVKEIRNDVIQATDLEDLKGVVENKLDNISQHIKEYREVEQKRYTRVKKDVFDMQNQMMSLEKESENLKSIIIEKNKEAMFDVLTEIPNRLAYEKKAAEEIARWKRFSNSLSLAIWDIDFFKKVNDTYGHKAGDKVLKTIAQLLNERIRETDFFARFGGEEFVMLLPGTEENETLTLVNNLRKKVESCNFKYKGSAVGITVSCGISTFREGDTLEAVFERADNALYKAKENGRNQCVVDDS